MRLWHSLNRLSLSLHHSFGHCFWFTIARWTDVVCIRKLTSIHQCKGCHKHNFPRNRDKKCVRFDTQRMGSMAVLWHFTWHQNTWQIFWISFWPHRRYRRRLISYTPRSWNVFTRKVNYYSNDLRSISHACFLPMANPLQTLGSSSSAHDAFITLCRSVNTMFCSLLELFLLTIRNGRRYSEWVCAAGNLHIFWMHNEFSSFLVSIIPCREQCDRTFLYHLRLAVVSLHSGLFNWKKAKKKEWKNERNWMETNLNKWKSKWSLSLWRSKL